MERSVSVTGEEEGDVHVYRAVESLLPMAGLMRSPCGACPVHRDCSESRGIVNPTRCTYIKEWFSS